MRAAVPTETVAGEKRVAVVPEVVPQLMKLGYTVAVQSGAGMRAGFSDSAYEAAGASIEADAAAVYAGADMVLKVQRPSNEEIAMIGPGTVLIGLLQPASTPVHLDVLAKRGIAA